MAKKLSKSGIVTSQTVQAWHVSQSIDAFTAVDAYNILTSGSITHTGSLAIKGTLDIRGAGSITASGDISSSSTVFGLTGSFSHISGSSPLSIEADNWAVNKSGNLKFMRYKNATVNSSETETINLGSDDYISWVLMRSVISVALNTVSGLSNSTIFQLPEVELASMLGASITFVVATDSSTNAGLFFKKADDDDPCIVSRIACSDGSTTNGDGSGVGVTANQVKSGDQFTLTCDGVHWYVNGIISGDKSLVTAIP